MVKHEFRSRLHLFFLIFFSLFHFSVFSHGFHKDTIVRCSNYGCKKTVSQMVEHTGENFFHSLISYDTRKSKWHNWIYKNKTRWVEKKAKAGGYSRIPCHCIVSFDAPLPAAVPPSNPPPFDTYNPRLEPFTVTCSPTQEFYRIPDNNWVPVHKLKNGDLLLAEHNKQVRLNAISLIKEPLDIYTIEIKNTHVFLVTKYGLLVHNCPVPWGIVATLTIPCGTGSFEGAKIGSYFGPVGFTCGAVVGGVVAGAIAYGMRDNKREYTVSLEDPNIYSSVLPKNAKPIEGTTTTDKPKAEEQPKSQGKAPGKPTANDGFKPKKNGDGEKVKHPKNGSYGWPDKQGNIWVPSGPNGHGGPHWDVQSPDGKSYANVLPGGKIR